MKILVIQNDPITPAGICEERVRARGGTIEPVLGCRGEPLPRKSDGYDGAMVLGGPQHAWDDKANPEFPAILDLLREFHAADKPLLGICLGGQLMSRAFGGEVHAHRELEFGFPELEITAAGAADPLLAAASPRPRIMQWHEDAFTLPPGSTHLLAGKACENQGFRYGAHAYGFQCHFEATLPLVEGWLVGAKAGLMRHLGETMPDHVARMRREWQDHGPGARRFAETVTDRWLDLAAETRRSADR